MVARAVLAAAPDESEAYRMLALVAFASDRAENAVGLLQQAIALRPNSAIAYDNLSFMLRILGAIEQAETAAEHALALAPNDADYLCNHATALEAQGRLEEARRQFERALAVNPNHATAHGNLLSCLQYSYGVGLAELAAAHADWDRRHGQPLRAAWRPWTNVRDPRRPLKLGFVSPDFGFHPVGFFLVGLFENLDRAEAQVACYSGRRRIDALTHRLRAATDLWRDVVVLSDETLAEQIRGDEIDILFDLSGHTGGNRLGVFARKPAPIQMTWAGYVGTTGLSAIDYLVADRYQVPAGAERWFCERVLRLPDDYICYTPLVDAPEVGPLPALAKGYITFGGFNNPAKYSPAVIALWSELLRRLPDARLILKHTLPEGGRLRQRLRAMFQNEGIEPGRVEFRDWTARLDLLATYNEIDLALDPFPYSGGLTTCEALWMGVPVVTLPGETFASRHSLTHVSNVGITETVADSPEDYVGRAVKLARNLPRLAEIRAGLRQQMARSPLCDARRFAANFAAAMREAWQRWLAGNDTAAESNVKCKM
jgi:predicted O-linked N-acetylglucosamine transferase (SPINDLY family)